MSTYIPSSELSLINNSDAPSQHTVSEGLRAVLATAMAIGESAPDYYDVTVLPLVELWGFGASGRSSSPPSNEEIEQSLAIVGWDRFRLNGNVLSRDVQVQIDLSSIAKGYAVDQVAELLTSLGYSRYLVEIGGEIYTSGRNSRGKLWRVGIEQPRIEGGSPIRALVVSGSAVATSGDYRNFSSRKGVVTGILLARLPVSQFRRTHYRSP